MFLAFLPFFYIIQIKYTKKELIKISKQIIKNITCDIEKLRSFYEYHTYEQCKKCPVCGKYYTHLKREFCLNCKKKNLKVKLKETVKERIGSISHDLKLYNCCCEFGSLHSKSKFWKETRKNTICKHALVAIREIMRKKNDKNKK